MNNRNYAGVVFGCTSVTVDGTIKPLTFNAIDHSKDERAFKIAVKALRDRHNRCLESLEEHKDVASYTSHQAFWETGRFSAPVYDAVEEFLNSDLSSNWEIFKNHKSSRNKLILQQIIRALYECPVDELSQLAFNIATELILCI